jgi:hypothetical protein
MIEIALARINSFASPAPTPDFIQALLAELSSLREEVAQLREDNQNLREKAASLESRQDNTEAWQDKHSLENALAYQRLKALEYKDPQPAQRDRADILLALLAANDGKMLRSVARKKMRLSESRFSELLAVMGSDIEIKPFHKDERKKLLCLKINNC